ncbi:phage portal protein, partial [Bacillus thuringiensis]|nr:phage portal protein [Bacillus thuringiensis]
ERKFQKSFRLRHKLILSTLGLLEKANDAAEIQVVMTRNIPANIIELAELAAKIPPGLFSNETLREQFPFAYNEEIEKKRIEAEKEKQLESEMGANPFANPPNNGDKPPEGGNPTEPPKNEPPKE